MNTNTAVATLPQSHSFPALLKQHQAEIARALPKHLNPDRLSRIALTEFRKNPKLSECQPLSVFAAVIMASQLGLEPGINGQCYLIPYKTECQFVTGWKGLVDLVNRTGRSAVWTGAVYEGDDFDWALGDRPYVKHRPGGEDDPRLMTHVYAVGRVNGSEYPVIECWPASRVWKHRDRYNKVGKAHYSYRHPEMYARKVVLLQVIKYLPSSIELSRAIDLEYAADAGKQGLTINGAVTGDWAPPIDDAPLLPAPEALPEMNPDTGEVPAAMVTPELAPAPVDPCADLLQVIGEARTVADLEALSRDIGRLRNGERVRVVAAWKAKKEALQLNHAYPAPE